MAITKSAKKAWRKSLKRRARNLGIKIKLKKLLKEVSLASLPQIYKALDKATKRGIIKKNAASRKKSQIALAVSKLGDKKV